MFHIKQGNLKLHNEDVVERINHTKLNDDTFNRKISSSMRFRRLCQHIWFLENYDKIEQPVSTFVFESKVRSIHPGATRIIAASILGKEYIDSIIVYDPSSRMYVRDITVNLREPTSQIVLEPRRRWKNAEGVHRNWDICVKEDYANNTQTMDNFFKFTEDYVKEKHDRHLINTIVSNLHKLNDEQKIKFWTKLPEILKNEQ